MIAEVHQLKTALTLDNESAIQVLEDVLQEAREGSISAVCVVFVRPDGSANTSTSTTTQFPALLGGLAIANFRLIAEAT